MKQTKNTTPRHCEVRSNPETSVSHYKIHPSGLSHSAPLRSQWQIYQKPNKPASVMGFTLVELIVVITILAILGTIGFIQLWSFAGSARDSARISNLTNLKKGLDLFQIKSGTYPMPESSVAITASGVIIGYQGFAKDVVSWLAKLSPGGTVDPSDATMFTTYTVNKNQTKMQAMVFLEDGGSVSAFLPPLERGVGGIFPTANASSTTDYSKRFPTTTGDSLGILLSNSWTTLNQPIQENTAIIASGSLDIVSTNTGYLAVFSKTTTVNGTGIVLAQIKNTMITGGSKFPGCDTYDIVVGNQVWAACNMGATIAFNGSNGGTYNASPSATRGWNDEVNGKLYQWGRNKWFTSSDQTQQTQLTSNPNANDTYNFVWNGTLSNNDWLSPQIDTIWGGSVTDSATVDAQTNDTLRQGPCPSGWHVPSAKDWQDACNTITGGTCTNGMANTSVRTTLALPYAGDRNWNNGQYYNQSTYGYYWSSSPTSTNAFNLYFNSANVWPSNNSSRAIGFSLRCLKD